MDTSCPRSMLPVTGPSWWMAWRRRGFGWSGLGPGRPHRDVEGKRGAAAAGARRLRAAVRPEGLVTTEEQERERRHRRALKRLDSKAWRECHTRHDTSMRARARKMLPPGCDPEDAVAEAWATAVENISHYDVRYPPGPWLLSITRNQCLDQRRRHRRIRFRGGVAALPAGGGDPGAVLAAREPRVRCSYASRHANDWPSTSSTSRGWSPPPRPRSST